MNFKIFASTKGLVLSRKKAYGNYQNYMITVNDNGKVKTLCCSAIIDGDEAIAEVEHSPCFRRVSKSTFPVHPRDMVDLLDWIGDNEITHIEFVGLVSNICVISNLCVFQGAFPLAQTVVSPDLIASHDPKAHDAVLEVMRGLQVELL